MNNKISLSDLVAAFSASQNVSKKRADLFVRTVFEIIQEYVVRDELVKIKGLGTFKMISVGSRESVNVNTQERIVIEGHSKITFTPDKALADQVNKPFAGFTTVILNPGTSTEDMEAMDFDENGLPTGEGTTVTETDAADSAETTLMGFVPTPLEQAVEETQTEEPPTEEPPTEEPQTEELPTEEPQTVEVNEPEPVVESVHEPEMAETTETVSEEITSEETAVPEAEQPAVEQAKLTPEAVQQMMNEMLDKKLAKRSGISISRGWMVALIVAVLALAVGTFMMGYRMGSAHAGSSKPHSEVVPPKHQPKAKPQPQPASAKPEKVQTEKPKDVHAVQPQTEKSATEQSPAPKRDVKSQAAKYEQLPGGGYLIVGTKAEHTMAVGDNLYKLARQHYGDNDFVRYIIFYNKFENPDKIHLGQTIKLPELVKKD